MKRIIAIDPGTRTYGVAIVDVLEDGGIVLVQCWQHEAKIGNWKAAVSLLQAGLGGWIMAHGNEGPEIQVVVEDFVPRAGCTKPAADVLKVVGVLELDMEAIPMTYDAWRVSWGDLAMGWVRRSGQQPDAWLPSAALEHARDAAKMGASAATFYGGKFLDVRKAQEG